MNSQTNLAGRGIIVTRPSTQALTLCQMIEVHKGHAYSFPVLEISAVENTTLLTAFSEHLHEYAVVFFVSPNAVQFALQTLPPLPQWPPHIQLSCIGPGTTQALLAHGATQKIVAPNTNFDSESLLALPAFQASQIYNQRVAVLKGNGGRDLIVDTLKARGAQVDAIQCYQRNRATTDPAPILKAYSQNQLHAVTLTSSESVAHFVAMLSPASESILRTLPVFVPHPRIGETAQQFGASETVLTGPGDNNLVDSLLQYFS